MDTGLLVMLLAWVGVAIWVSVIIFNQKKYHPKALFTLFFTEMWERFSFYGMRALLILYMTKELFKLMETGQADARAYGIYGAYNALLYAAPVIGGLLADKIMGFRKAIMLGGIFMAIGQFVLSYTTTLDPQVAIGSIFSKEWFFFVGLGLLTVGNGFFKPNISSFLGTFYDQNDKRKDSAFTIFYMGINVGAFLAPLTCGYLGESVDWSLGFLVAGIGMLVGLIQFYVSMRKYQTEGMPPDRNELKRPVFAGLSKEWMIILGSLMIVPVFALLIDAEGITNYILIIVGVICLGYLVVSALTQENRVEGKRLLVFVFLFFFHMIFWALFEQAGGSLNILTDRYVNRHGIEASQFQALNPLYIIVLAPVFSWIWRKLSINGMEPWTPTKFFLGLLQMAIGYAIIVWGARSVIGTENMIPIVFIMGMYLFHTTGELSLSPVGLSVVTKLSPGKIVGFVMGSWFLSIAFAHKIAGILGQLIASPGTDMTRDGALNMFSQVYLEWGVYVVLGAALLLLFITPLLRRWMHGIH
jgi:POT family proton-dependent oligopeptide transporter